MEEKHASASRRYIPSAANRPGSVNGRDFNKSLYKYRSRPTYRLPTLFRCVPLHTLTTLITWGNRVFTRVIPPVGGYHVAEIESIGVRGGAKFPVPPGLDLHDSVPLKYRK